MKEAPRFDDGEPLKREAGTRYCDKGSHLLRSVFHRALVKAGKLGLEKGDLVLSEELPQTPLLSPTKDESPS